MSAMGVAGLGSQQSLPYHKIKPMARGESCAMAILQLPCPETKEPEQVPVWIQTFAALVSIGVGLVTIFGKRP